MEGTIASGEGINIPIQLKSKQPNSLETNIVHIQDCEFKNYDIGDYSQSLYVSDDIFILGYPKGITDYTMQRISSIVGHICVHFSDWSPCLFHPASFTSIQMPPRQ